MNTDRKREKGPSRRDLYGFFAEVRALLDGKAESKGYSSGTVQVADVIQGYVGPAGEFAEILRRSVRYLRKGNREDLAKIAASAFLLWRSHVRPGGPRGERGRR